MKKKIPQLLLIVALVLVIVGSIAAQAFNTGLYSTSVKRISFETERGVLSGLLYMPKDASESNPRPAVIVTHGYLNSAEMQDANAIELSRRGYVVLALDMYDHGHSAGNEKNTGGFLNFWPRALYDAAQYMYDQKYVLKDEAGNGIIGVTGHSMGGFSSSMALWYDEQDFATTGIRKIYTGISMGSDFSYTAWLGLTVDGAAAAGGGRTMGKLAGQFDEFFFNPEGAPGTVVKKDYVATTEGKTWLEQEAPEAGVWYETADGGKRIIYQPYETHPWNHFSTTSTGMVVDFYTEAFADYNDGIKAIPSDNQVWLWKEIFSCVALVGLMLMVVPVIMLIVKLPFFSKAVTGAVAPMKSGAGVGTFAILMFAILVPALIFPACVGAGGSKDWIFKISVLLGLVGAVSIVSFLKNKVQKNLFGGIGLLVGAAGLAWTMKSVSYAGDAPSVNDIAFWTLACAFLAITVMSLVYLFVKADQGAKLENYGLKASPIAIVASLCTAIVGVIAVYVVVFLVDAIFKTDFRLWVFAFKTFEFSILPKIFYYLPTFLLYYIVSSSAIAINCNTEKLQGWKGYVLAMLLNAGGITVLLINQYGTLFATGTAVYPGMALPGILLVAMVPTLAIAACFSKALYKRTGNIWTPAFFNAILMTLMTIANTCVYHQ
ncbi:MAG: alpha/beta hydrolase [Clostridia bacterium]|nr:alpha/beta hydrolase [Clostridia bacterium]